MKRWFLPEVPDLLGLLRRHAEVVREGIDQFASWSDSSDSGDGIRATADTADQARRELQTSLRTAFTTPLDPEDIYELSERLDVVINSAKNIVREADALAMAPDEPMATMAGGLVTGFAHVRDAFEALGRDDGAASVASDAAVVSCREVETTYSAAMSSLLAIDDLREVMGRRELYRRYARMADAIEAVAERIWYALVKSP